MAKFRLLAGQHIGPDKRHYKKGDTIESDTDLAVRFGREKFERIGDDPGASKVLSTQNAAPQGQVSSGFQVSSGANQPQVSTPQPPVQVVAETAREAQQMVEEARQAAAGPAVQVERTETAVTAIPTAPVGSSLPKPVGRTGPTLQTEKGTVEKAAEKK